MASSPEKRLKELKKAFDDLDLNHDGRLDSSEIRQLLQSYGQNPTEEDVTNLIKEYDKNGNNTIEFDEFVDYFEKNKKDPCTIREDLEQAFKVIDRDGDGKISVDELKYIMSKLGERLSEEEVHQMISKADIDGDGKVDYQEYIDLMCPKQDQYFQE